MKKALFIIGIFLLVFSCRKSEIRSVSSISPQTAFTACGVTDAAETDFFRKHPNGLPPKFANNLAFMPDTFVIYISKGGVVPNGTPWNGGIGFTGTAPNFTPVQWDWILQKVTGKYSPWRAKVTLDSNLYNAANHFSRMKCIVGNGMTPYLGNVGGISFVGSVGYGDGTPCFVLADNLAFSQVAVATAVAHEVGHTVGLFHQALVSGTNCTVLNQYNTGLGTGQLSWVPIMGVNYNDSLITWHIGSTNQPTGNPFPNCYVQQNDFQVLSEQIGLATDLDAGVQLGTHRTIGMNQTLEGCANVYYNPTTHVYYAGADNDFITIAASAINGHVTLTSTGDVDYRLQIRYFSGPLTEYDDPGSPNISAKAYTNGQYFMIAPLFYQANSPYAPITDMSGK